MQRAKRKVKQQLPRPTLLGDLGSLENELNPHCLSICSKKEDTLTRLRDICRRADPNDEQEVQIISRQCVEFLEDNGKGHGIVIEILLECGWYFGEVGLYPEFHAIVLQALQYSEVEKDLSLQRRVHNILSGAYSRKCDFSKACIHTELAYGMAIKINDPMFILASSVNTVALLHQMGLLENARELALKVTKQPCFNNRTAYLHLMNANNGMKIAHHLRDMRSAERFYRVASEKISIANTAVTEVTRAYFISACVEHLTLNNKLQEALDLLDALNEEDLAKENVRIRALIYCAQAEANIAVADPVKIKVSQVKLEMLVNETEHIPQHYEEVLRILIKLYNNKLEASSTLTQTKLLKTLRLLREHLVSVKHKSFFIEASASDLSIPGSSGVFGNPVYVVPPWIEAIDPSIEASHGKGEYGKSFVKKVPFDIPDLAKMDIAHPLRSGQFKTAENWAVAAEFLSGGTGRHCFQVGRLASAIALELGWSEKECLTLGLACRLHDIGKVAICRGQAGTNDRRPFGRFSPFCEHTWAGQHLLARGTDDIFLLASSVALNHHEWWNGCGYPSGLSKTAIPLEARICAIADTFISLVDPDKGQNAWAVEDATRQIRTMSGVQLDPDLVDPLINAVVKKIEILKSRNEIDSDFSGNQLIQAKSKLCNAFQLAD